MILLFSLTALALCSCTTVNPANSNAKERLPNSVYDQIGSEDPQYKSRLTIENGGFTAQFLRNGIAVRGDPGSGGALRIEQTADFIYVRGLGVIVAKKPGFEFKAGVSTCKSLAWEQGGVATNCAYVDGSQSSFAGFDASGGLQEFIGPCAGGGMCRYRRIAGSGIIR